MEGDSRMAFSGDDLFDEEEWIDLEADALVEAILTFTGQARRWRDPRGGCENAAPSLGA